MKKQYKTKHPMWRKLPTAIFAQLWLWVIFLLALFFLGPGNKSGPIFKSSLTISEIALALVASLLVGCLTFVKIWGPTQEETYDQSQTFMEYFRFVLFPFILISITLLGSVFWAYNW